jgi:hypothetical protein
MALVRFVKIVARLQDVLEQVEAQVQEAEAGSRGTVLVLPSIPLII